MDIDVAIPKAAALLGKGGKLPAGVDVIKKSEAEILKTVHAFKKTVETLQQNLLDSEKAMSNYKLTVKQFSDRVANSDFGLDEGNKDEAAKIKQAQDLLGSAAKDEMQWADKIIKSLDELDKHTMALASYKSPTD